METFESMKSASKHRVIKYYSESFSPVAFKRCYVASLDLDFELNRSSDPLAKSCYKFVDILKASITKLKYSWYKQMNKTSSNLTNFTCFFLLLFFELLNPSVMNRPISLSFLASRNFNIGNQFIWSTCIRNR